MSLRSGNRSVKKVYRPKTKSKCRSGAISGTSPRGGSGLIDSLTGVVGRIGNNILRTNHASDFATEKIHRPQDRAYDRHNDHVLGCAARNQKEIHLLLHKFCQWLPFSSTPLFRRLTLPHVAA